MKFAHMGDCHLGSWAQPELRDLNFKCFQYAVEKCIKEKAEFVLITGDLFDSAYPSIDTLKESFAEFKKLKDSGIPVFLIAGSHDYSVSGRTFLEVLEKSGFCKNVSDFDSRNGSIVLLPTIHKNVALYGYPGKKSNLEMSDLQNMKIQDSPGLFKILMLHTAISDALNNPNIPSIDHKYLPKVDYLAMSHLHIDYNRENRVYSGPIFPNNITELEELQGGSFYLFNNGNIKKETIKLKDVLTLTFEVKNPSTLADEILNAMKDSVVKDKIIILKLQGILEQGSPADIDFRKIELQLKKMCAYSILKSTTRIFGNEPEITLDVLNTGHLESEIIKKFEENNPGKFNHFIPELMKALQLEKIEDERIALFEDRIMVETRKVLDLS